MSATESDPTTCSREADLRSRTARGALLNGVFLVLTTAIGAAEGLAVAHFVTPSQYAVWGILLSAIALIWWLKDVGIGDKYIQQSELDQADAFAHAFGINLLVMAGCFAVLLVAAPTLAFLYGRPELLAPALAVSLIVPAYALQFPMVVLQRRLQWRRQRSLAAIEPVTGLVVTLVLVIAGAGYWGLVIGALSGAWACAIAAMRASPFPIRARLRGKSLRAYLSFSGPIAFYSGAGIVVGQGVFLTSAHTVGLGGVGAIALAINIAQFTDKADAVVTQTIYPAICAVQHRTDLLRETFQTSNRLTLMWGMPFGIALTLFAPDLVRFVLGHRWHQTVPLLQALGLIGATHHIAFNWDAFYRARGDSRPLAWAGAFIIAFTLLVTVPLIATLGFTGFVVGMAAGQAAYLGLRASLLERLLPEVHFARHVARAVTPSVAPVALVVAIRFAEPRQRTFAIAVTELTTYILTTALATWVFERDLIKEVYGYLRRRSASPLTIDAS